MTEIRSSGVCPYCGMTTWWEGMCVLPGCEGHTERERTHSYGMRCATHGEVKRVPCACGHDHGTTDVECGGWCPEYTPKPRAGTADAWPNRDWREDR